MSTRLILATATLLSVPAFAQTTWTSFEDRKGHAIASDPTGGVLMFGGESSTSWGEYRDDTNAFVNSSTSPTWTQLNPFGSPSARTEHAMAAGSSNDDIAIFILFGGLAEPNGGGTAVPSDETFVYDGSGWGHVGVTATHPSARTGHAMVTDTRRNRILLFGGFSGGFAVNDLWEFDPVNDVWLQPTVTGSSPPSRFDHAMTFHPGNGANDGRVYVFGGTPFRNDIWEWQFDGGTSTSTWTDVTPAVRPGGRRRAAMAYLPAFDHVVMFGGQDNMLNPLDDTWVWDRASATWTQRSPLNSPPGRWDHAMAADQLGNNVVLLGGDDGSGAALEGTWLWTGIDWAKRLPPPSPRTDIAMAYDSSRDRHPVFGGRTIPGGADLDETWELDGLNWRERSPSTRPSARADAGLAFDSARNRTVLYGGRTGGACGTELGDTWEWDGQSWSPKVTANSPPAAGGVQPVFDSTRNVTWMLTGSEMWSYDGNDWVPPEIPTGRNGFGFAYDTARGRLVIAGGSNSAYPYMNETWEWDGSRWYERAPISQTLRYPSMAYDAARQNCVLFGGSNSSGYSLGNTRVWNGIAWSEPAPVYSTGRFNPTMAFDSRPGREVVVDFGGFYSSPTQTSLIDVTKEWDGTAWTTYFGNPRPSPRQACAAAFDPLRGEVVFFGGLSQGGTSSETWRFDGVSWSQANPAGSPSARYYSRMALDSTTGSLVLFGGVASATGGTWLGDTWDWDGTNWTQRLPATNPRGRGAHALFHTGQRTLMWGGGDQTSNFGDMWEWTGGDWILVESGPPPSRTNYGAAYDAQRDRTVVFGGRATCGAGSYLDETWEWNGDSWLQRFPANAPSPRERSKLTFDEARGRVVLFGGTDGTNTFSDTWEWDGDNWTARLPTNSPPGSYGHGLTFDQQRRVTVAFGSAGTWDYGPTDPAAIEFYGTGCAGPNGIPALAPKPWAGPWLGGQLEVELINAPSNGLGLFVWGFSETNWSGFALPLALGAFGAPACSLYASSDLTQLFLAGTNPYVSFLLPNHGSFLGARMRAQAGFLPIGSSPVVSNALRMTFGSK